MVKRLRFFLFSFVFFVLQGNVYGMKQVKQEIPKGTGRETKQPAKLHSPKDTVVIAEASDQERLQPYQKTIQQQLLQAIFIFLQMPAEGEVNAAQLCLAGKNVFLDEFLCPEIKKAERCMKDGGLDPELDALMGKLFGPDEGEEKEVDDFTKLSYQNFNPVLFRLVQEYERVTLKIVQQRSAGDGKRPLKVKGRDFIDVASSLYILYATFLVFIDLKTKEYIKNNIIGSEALARLIPLKSCFMHGRFFRVSVDDIDLLIAANNAILEFFLHDLGFAKPRAQVKFQKLLPDQAAFFAQAKKYWIAVQKSRITTEFLSDFERLRAAIRKDSFLLQRRQEAIERACSNEKLRIHLMRSLERMFIPKTLTGEMAALAIA